MISRTADDMIRDYRAGISDISKRIEERMRERDRTTKNTAAYENLSARIYDMEIMKCDMQLALKNVREYYSD